MACIIHWKKKRSHFDLKNWVTGGKKIRLVIPSNWRIFESNWLDIKSEIVLNILQLLWIPGWILVPPVTLLFRAKWLHFSFSVDLFQQFYCLLFRVNLCVSIYWSSFSTVSLVKFFLALKLTNCLYRLWIKSILLFKKTHKLTLNLIYLYASFTF